MEKGKSRELFLVRGKKSLLFDENVEMKGRALFPPGSGSGLDLNSELSGDEKGDRTGRPQKKMIMMRMMRTLPSFKTPISETPPFFWSVSNILIAVLRSRNLVGQEGREGRRRQGRNNNPKPKLCIGNGNGNRTLP